VEFSGEAVGDLRLYDYRTPDAGLYDGTPFIIMIPPERVRENGRDENGTVGRVGR
jgi:hypothetical protein